MLADGADNGDGKWVPKCKRVVIRNLVPLDVREIGLSERLLGEITFQQIALLLAADMDTLSLAQKSGELRAPDLDRQPPVA